MAKSRRHQLPPSTTRTWPVTKAAKGDASHVAAQPISCGSPTRPAGWRRASTRSSRAARSAAGMSSCGNSPGAIAFTRTPSGAHSTASDFVRLTTPAFAAAECAMPGPPVIAAVVAMLTIAADAPRATARRCSSCEQKNVPSSTMRSTARQPLGNRSAAATGKLAAALLTSTVTGAPSVEAAASYAVATDSGSRTSSSTSQARPPTSCTAATPPSRCSVDRLAIATAAPARASSTEIALPSPVPPPVTSATRPANVSAGNIGVPAGRGLAILTALPAHERDQHGRGNRTTRHRRHEVDHVREARRLFALELDRLFCGLCGVALGHVVGHELHGRTHRLEPQCLGEPMVGEGVDGALDALHGKRSIVADLAGDAVRRLVERVARHNSLHDMQSLRGFRIDAPTGQCQQLGPAGTDLAGKSQVSAGIHAHAGRRLR